MKYTDRGQLTVIQLDKYVEGILVEECKRILLEFPSNIIYCEQQGKLIGIISTGDIVRAYRKRMAYIRINKVFSYVLIGESMKARTVFKEKRSINALPVISEDGVLVGDYTRWDDSLWLTANIDAGGGYSNEGRKLGLKIAIVRPGNKFKDRQKLFKIFFDYMAKRNVSVYCIDYSEVFQYMKLADWILVSDENELRAFGTLCNILGAEIKDNGHKISTYKRAMERVWSDNGQCAAQISDLQNQGITIVGLDWTETPYYEYLMEEIERRFSAIGQVPSNQLPHNFYKDFFDNLYSEEYAHEILNITFAVENKKGAMYLRDCNSRYYNVVNGERRTTGQPKVYEKTIYFIGPCYIYGHFVEDRHTIESFLQKRLCESGKAVRVVNFGCTGMQTSYQYFAKIMAGVELKKGDIIVIGKILDNLSIEFLDLSKTLEKNKVEAEWLVNYPGHCNHKVNKLYADVIYEKLESVITEKTQDQGTMLKKGSDFIKILYLDRYFSNFNAAHFRRIGSIVMNCNPFTFGHRYLIEKALETVDYLILFVVEEDLSLFSFTERFVMVREGVADLSNVIVVPSGPFILSNMSFPEYFIKETSADIKSHVEQDVETFAEKIAMPLGIGYQFVGEEPEDGVTDEYNKAMKRILPRYGIELVEIPRKTINGKYISASSARKFMDAGDNAKAAELLPETTRKRVGNCGV